MSARRRKPPLGQHFLVSESVIHDIIDAIALKTNDTIVEIGPGRGVLTERIVGKVSEFHAIELDSQLAAYLKNKFSADNVKIHTADALKFDYPSVFTENTKVRLIGNLPYSISTELILQLTNHLASIEDFCFMVQREVAQRLTADCGTKQYGRLTVSVSRVLHVEALFDVVAEAFSPPPDVKSTVIHMRPKLTNRVSRELTVQFNELVRIAFSKRRKTLKNALIGYVSEYSLEQVEIDSSLRAEHITVAQFERLAKYLVDKPCT